MPVRLITPSGCACWRVRVFGSTFSPPPPTRRFPPGSADGARRSGSPPLGLTAARAHRRSGSPPLGLTAARAHRRSGSPPLGLTAARAHRRSGSPPLWLTAARAHRRSGTPPLGLTAARAHRRSGSPPLGLTSARAQRRSGSPPLGLNAARAHRRSGSPPRAMADRRRPFDSVPLKDGFARGDEMTPRNGGVNVVGRAGLRERRRALSADGFREADALCVPKRSDSGTLTHPGKDGGVLGPTDAHRHFCSSIDFALL